jgi:hypothetical protein
MGLRGPSFVGSGSSRRKFPGVFASFENGFIPVGFCFVAHWPMKQSPVAKQTR